MAKVPARLIEGIAVRLDEEGISTSVNLDIESLYPCHPGYDASAMWMPVALEDTGQVRRAQFGLGGEIVDWGDIAGLPATFPPTLPITIGDVTGLQDALDDIDAVDDTQNAALAALQALLDDLDDRVTILEDIVPAAFVFVDVTDAAISTVYTSNAITVTDIGLASPISIVGGTYSINAGTYTAAAGVAHEGDIITVRGTSSALNETTVDVVLTIGGVSDTYSITTVQQYEDLDYVAPSLMLNTTTEPLQYMTIQISVDTEGYADLTPASVARDIMVAGQMITVAPVPRQHMMADQYINTQAP